MSARIIDIIDALVSSINGETWTQTFTATRGYGQRMKPSELSALKVILAPLTRAREYQDRGTSQLEYEIDIGFFKHISGAIAARDLEVDDLVELVDELEVFWMSRNITVGPSKLTTIVSNTDPIFDGELLRDSGVFASVLSLTFTEVL